MKARRFLIPSLALAGLMKGGPVAATPPGDQADGAKAPLDPAVYDVFRQDHLFTLAGHRSHSSHASHSSGSSGIVRSPSYYGGSSSVFSPPASPRTRNYDSTPPSTVLPSSPAIATAPKPLRGNTSRFQSVVRQVQLGLRSYGYYQGAIDGVVGPATKTAIVKFQTDYNLKVTGTITPQVLDALRISA